MLRVKWPPSDSKIECGYKQVIFKIIYHIASSYNPSHYFFCYELLVSLTVYALFWQNYDHT